MAFVTISVHDITSIRVEEPGRLSGTGNWTGKIHITDCDDNVLTIDTFSPVPENLAIQQDEDE